MTNGDLDIQLLVMDSDGVLTDGGIYVSDVGIESRRFNVKDGAWIRLWERAGFKTAIITGKKSPALKTRANQLDINYVYENCHYKLETLHELSKASGVPFKNMAYIGDDLIDIPALKKVGISFAPKDAVEEVRAICGHVTTAKGGQGVVVEVVKYLLIAMGKYEAAIKTYLERQAGETDFATGG
jgi:3-deoxy-D-manno-octulosonate 8-phosphate phosphatase (KDO 8-P phosphatase)